MLISQVAPYSTYGVSSTSLTPTLKTFQAPKTTAAYAPKAYEVELSGAAKAKSLKMQGYSASLIALKMGLDLSTVNQYLGITATTADIAFKTTYVEPKAAYTEPRVVTQGREQLASDLNDMSFAQYTWSNMIKTLSNETSWLKESLLA